MSSMRYMTTRQAAEYLQVHPRTIQRLAREGEVRSARVGRCFRFLVEWLDEYANRATPSDASAFRA